MRVCLLIIAFGCVSSALAQTPIATISSGESFAVGGVRVPVAGLPSWPLMPGDIVTTGEGPAVISFGNRGRLVLDKSSKLQLQSGPLQAIVAGGTVTPGTVVSVPISAVLLQGGVSVRSDRGSGLQVLALGQAINPPAGSEMAVAIHGNRVLTGPSTSSLDAKISGLKPSSRVAAARPKPTPTPTPTPPPPPSPK